jgi:hypothetical protein
MRRLIFCLLIFIPITLKAQILDFSMSIGTGKTYIIEDWYNSVDVNYVLPLSLMTELKYSPLNSNWGIKLRLHNLQSTCSGENWVDGSQLDGYISSLTTSLLLEKAKYKNSFSFGFNFGIGWTRETIQPLQSVPSEKDISNYPTLIVGEHLTWKLNDNFDLQLFPVLLWQDPFKSIGYLTGKQSANFAGEDLSFSFNIGIRYHLLK